MVGELVLDDWYEDRELAISFDDGDLIAFRIWNICDSYGIQKRVGSPMRISLNKKDSLRLAKFITDCWENS